MKDSSDGVDRRVQLITVPSCDLHNSAKSKDDEYLLGVLAVSILNNTVGTDQAKTKLIRALEKSPGLAAAVLADTREVVVENLENGEVSPTVAFRLDDDRIANIFEHVARAIYFHEYATHWPGSVLSFPEFSMAIDGENSVSRNDRYEEIRQTADQLLQNCEEHGSNPDVFTYQIFNAVEETGMLMMRLNFYEGTCTICKFSS